MDPQFQDVGSELRASFVHGVVVLQCSSDVAAHLRRFDLFRASLGDSPAAVRLRQDGSLESMLEFLHFHVDAASLDGAVVMFSAAGIGCASQPQMPGLLLNVWSCEPGTPGTYRTGANLRRREHVAEKTP